MNFTSQQLVRNGVIECEGSLTAVFPLLCPKREEEWIPGWECETIWSKSGYNEEGAIFRTLKPYGVELYWHTLRYDMAARMVDFLIIAPHLYLFRFTIEVRESGRGGLSLLFHQVFTSVSKKGNDLLEQYRAENYQEKLKILEEHLNRHMRR